MKVYLNKDNVAIMVDNNVEVEVTKTWFEKSKNKWWYILPTNSVNRKYLGVEALKKAGEIDCGNEVKVPRVLGSHNVSSNWQDYLSDEEKAIIEGIKQKCIERKQAVIESSKPTEADKLRAQIKRLEEKLAKM